MDYIIYALLFMRNKTVIFWLNQETLTERVNILSIILVNYPSASIGHAVVIEKY